MTYIKSNSKYARPKRYTFFSQGNSYTFDIAKNVSYDGKLVNILDLHKQEVRLRNSKDVFILTDTGEYLNCR